MSRICGVPALAEALTARLGALASRAVSAIVIVSRDLSPGLHEWFIDLRRLEARTSPAAR